MCGIGGGVDGSNGGGGVDGNGGNSGVGDSGESIMHMSYGGGESIVCIVYRSRGGGLCSSGWYFSVGWGFHGGGGGGCGTDGEGGGGVCCETRSVACEWEGIVFESL